LLQLDQNKLGVVPESAFFSILSLNNISLAEADKLQLVKLCRGKSATGPGQASGGADVLYKEAIAMLNVNYVEGEEDSADPFTQPWTIRANQSGAVNSMAYSMFGETRDTGGKSPMRAPEPFQAKGRLTKERMELMSERPTQSRKSQRSRLTQADAATHASSKAASQARRTSMDEKATNAATQVTKQATQISRASEAGSIAGGSTRTSPRPGPMASRGTKSFA